MEKAPAAPGVTAPDETNMQARYDHASTGSPLDQWRRVAETARPVPQLRLNDLQFIGIKIAGKLEVVHVARVIGTAARHDRAAGFKPPAGHPMGLFCQAGKR